MVFDTLFGMDSAYQIQPQMLEGFTVEDDGKRWKLTLRDGLLWHDGEKVLARDCVASIRRWAVRDGIGALLMARTDELSALDDKTIQFRLKKPFQILPYALGKISTPICAMMPERLANTDPFKAVSEMVGSGPFRFKADEWVSGSLAVYTKFDRYQPRQEIRHRLDRRRQGRAFRARGVACQPRRRHLGQRDAGRRDGLVGTADRGPAAGTEAAPAKSRSRSRIATARLAS